MMRIHSSHLINDDIKDWLCCILVMWVCVYFNHMHDILCACFEMCSEKKYVNLVFSSSCAVNNHIIPTEKSITAMILLILLRKITVMCVACNLSSTFYKTDNMFN